MALKTTILQVSLTKDTIMKKTNPESDLVSCMWCGSAGVVPPKSPKMTCPHCEGSGLQWRDPVKTRRGWGE